VTRDDILEFLSKQRDAWQRRDPGDLALGHAEHGIVESPIFAKVQGRDAIRKSYAALFQSFPDWTFSDQEPFIDGDRVAVPFTAWATHAGRFMGLDGTGRRFEIQGVLLMELRDGLIAHERRVYDFTGLLIQCGVLRGKPGF
jgi:predicted ester cyclase